MEQPSLLLVSITAMFGVFALLALLAVAMRVLIAVFPERAVEDDGAVLAAVTAAATAAYPGTKITSVTEIR
ncbi:MAG: hypothetical protein PVF27_00380 [Gemmatimonadales bacterium]|jgi:hypothetical protein